MGRIKGSDIELKIVHLLFESGSFGWRSPGSGTYIVENDPIPYTELQEKCKFDIEGVGHIDFGYDPKGYQTVDYGGFFIESNLSKRTKIIGSVDSHEMRVVEVKTIRLRESHLNKSEKDQIKKGIMEKKDINKKSHEMSATFNLLQTDMREYIKRDKQKVKNPYKGKLRKSDFCMELQRTWYFSEILKSLRNEKNEPIFNCKVNAYLQVRFIGSGTELWINIEDLNKYNSNNFDAERDKTFTMLVIEKDEKNEIIWYWKANRTYDLT